MKLPTIIQFSESLRLSEHTFKTLRGAVVCKDWSGNDLFIAGGNSVIFRIMMDDKQYAIKCYFNPQLYIHKSIEYFCANPNEFIDSSVRYLAEELWIWDTETQGRWCDVAIKLWTEGNTLGFELRRALNSSNKNRISELATIFDKAAVSILSQEWAHGDIKPENIIIKSNSIKLIDYGSFYIPSLSTPVCKELGTPQYQHPRRNAAYCNKHIDDYPIAIISATLHTLAYEPSLYKSFGNGDMLLFDPKAIFDGNRKSIEAAQKIAINQKDEILYKLIDTLTSPTPHIEDLTEILQAFK